MIVAIIIVLCVIPFVAGPLIFLEPQKKAPVEQPTELPPSPLPGTHRMGEFR